jgi:hypothetical protein
MDTLLEEIKIKEKEHILDRERFHDQIEIKKVDGYLEERQWKSCCFQLEPESSMFFAKLTISSMTIALCSYQLITQVDCSYQSLYSSLLSSVITFWLARKN